MKQMFDASVLEIEQSMINWRRWLHQNPELSFEEINTTRFIEEQLRSFGNIEVQKYTKTGVVGRIFGTKAGVPHVLGIRADIDALPMQEENDLPYRSCVPNAMHACGHDGHTAMLIAAAKLLSARRESFCGEVRLIFQHAEELPPGGAIELLQAGAVEGVERMLGLHLSSNWNTGVFGVRIGALTAAVDSFSITVHGKGGHCAFPEQTNDPIVAASEIVLALQTIVSRKIAATDAAVISVCRINGGTAYNIIPEKVTVEGAVRSFSEETRALIQSEMQSVCKGVALASHTTCTLNYQRGYPSVVNDAAITAACEALLLRRFGKENVERIDRIMPGEDYAYFTANRPGFFVELGTRNDEKRCNMPHHNSGYRLDEDALIYGLQYFMDATAEFLNGK